ncbi:MAG TPA: magnesium transporter [Pseudogracilibacillus sp.]|nr:magnesium transporter [Pseudogracilibacillus sp.]
MDRQQYYDSIYHAIKKGERDEFRELFLKLHERDQVEVFHLLYPDKKVKITEFLQPEEFAELFEEMDFDNQLAAFYYLPDTYLQNVFSYIADDDVVQFISQLDEEKRNEVLAVMKREDLEEIDSLLQQELETAGAIMTTELIRVSTEETADDVIADMRLIGAQAETIYYIYVVNQSNQLTGVLSLRDVLLSPGDTKVEEIMNTQTISVPQDMDQEEVARIIQEYDLLAVPVIDREDTLLGIVTVDDVIDIIHDEMTEDFHRFGGISGSDEERTEEETILQMTKNRLPWIIILIFLGLISANLIGAYEETLAQVVALAAFMPIILDSAGNVGTQSLAVSVRRLTLNEETEDSFWEMLGKEFGSGILIGLASAFTIGVLSYILYSNLVLSIIISSSLLITLSVSTVIGSVVPALFDKVGIDPAVASGPFITTTNDTFALIIYFSLASYFIQHL